MPFGLSTLPDKFQCQLNTALEGISGEISIVDNIMSFGKVDIMEEAIIDHDKNLLKSTAI